MQPTAVPPSSSASWHLAAAQQRDVHRARYQSEQSEAAASATVSAAATAPPSPVLHSPPRGGVLHSAPSTPPSSRAPASASAASAAAAAASSAGFGAGAAPRPASSRVKLYRNEEVILFRTPTDASHLVLFNLPSKPFLHPFYDLKTVAKARHDANDALSTEKTAAAATAAAASAAAATTAAAGVPAGSIAPPAAAASSVSAGPAVPLRPPLPPLRPLGAGPVAPTAAHLCATYHALHLQNVERVLHHLSRKYGLVHELSLQCKPRESGDGGLSGHKRRRNLYPIGGFDDDEDDSDPAYAPIAAYEAGFNIWAFIKYYSVLHAAHAHKELNRTQLINNQKIKAKMIQRNTSTHSPVKPPQTNTTAAAAAGAAAAVTSPIKSSTAGTGLRPCYPLGHHRCLDLCNYFLGFNSWNCSIQQMRKYNHVTDEDIMDDALRVSPMFHASQKEKFANSWTAQVVIEIAGQSFCCSGVGHAASKEGSSDAKKRAVTNAYRQLFASLALIILHNGKVAVQIIP